MELIVKTASYERDGSRHTYDKLIVKSATLGEVVLEPRADGYNHKKLITDFLISEILYGKEITD